MDSPTIKECFEYSGNMEQSTLFFHYFESQGWKVGKNPMKNWKSALTGWIKRSKSKQSNIEVALSNQNTATVDKFWKRMTQAFGHKWVSGFGPKPTKPWIDLISNLTNEKIAHGLQVMVKRAKVNKWPPDLLEFNELCQSYRSSQIAIKHYPSKTEVLALREGTKQARNSAMSEIRGIL